MDYQTLIDETKQKIDNFSFDDSTYTAIYDEARLRLSNAYKADEKNITASLNDARKKAVSENALATKSLQEELAVRGLAKSGESSMLRLNQRLSLSNALASLSSEAIKSKTDLYSKHQQTLADLETDLGKQKANAMENEKKALYERLAELEKLKAEDEKWRTEFDASEEKWRTEFDASEEKWRAELAAAEEKWRAELNAKYASSASGGGTGSQNGGSADGEENKNNNFKGNEALQGFLSGLTSSDGISPSYSAEKVANDIMTSCGADDKIIRSNEMQSRIYRELARLVISSNYSREYTLEVLNILRSHGFSVEFDIALARSDNLKRANYVYQTTYRTYYSALIRSGFNSNEAAVRAAERAKSYISDYIKSMNLSENEYNKVLDMLWLLN